MMGGEIHGYRKKYFWEGHYWDKEGELILVLEGLRQI